MNTLIDFIIALFRDDELGRAFVVDPSRALAEAGLAHVSAAQLGAVAATAVPEIGLRAEDPVTALQRAVSQQVGGDVPASRSEVGPTDSATPVVASGNSLLGDIPIDTEASHNDTEVHDNTTQLGSHNVTELASPDLTFGDFVLGDQNSASGDGAVAISGDASGDIVSGDGAVLGGGNEVDNDQLQTGSNSNIAYGDGSAVIQENLDQHEDFESAAVPFVDDSPLPTSRDAEPLGDEAYGPTEDASSSRVAEDAPASHPPLDFFQ